MVYLLWKGRAENTAFVIKNLFSLAYLENLLYLCTRNYLLRMKTRLILLIVLALSFGACNNVPDEPLVGTWSESGKLLMKVLEFHEDGKLVYYEKRGHTGGGGTCDAGPFASLHYSVQNDNKLLINGEAEGFNDDLMLDTVPFSYLTNYSIKGRTLTIDSFAYDGGRYSKFDKLKLYKQL